MKKLIWILFIFVAIQSFPVYTQDQSASKEEYICPMECKDLHFDKPGTCPVCGMDLVKKASFTKTDQRKRVTILIFDGVQIIDFSAPYEVLGQAQFKVVTVAATKAPITTSMNMTVTPQFDFKSVPPADILVVPGGSIDNPINSSETMEWIKKSSETAEYVLSVCNGAFLLAKAGLLDGLSATTFYGLLDEFAQQNPKTKVVRNQRYVDNGKIITTAGLTSGMDGSLHVISKILGKGEAQRIALHLEYNWQPDGKFARASLADLKLPGLNLPDGSRAKFLKTEGTTDRWDLEVAITTDMTRQELENHVQTTLVANANWKEIKSTDDPAVKNWSFSDREGKAWKAAVRFENAKQEKNTFVIKVALNRA